MRSVGNSLLGAQGLASYLNSPLSSQKTLLDFMNEKAAKKQKLSFTPAISPQDTAIINDTVEVYPKLSGQKSLKYNLI
jgi:hypothetical protein